MKENGKWKVNTKEVNTYKEWTNKEGKKIAFGKTWIQIFQSSPENLLTLSEEFLEKVVKLLAISKDVQVCNKEKR